MLELLWPLPPLPAVDSGVSRLVVVDGALKAGAGGGLKPPRDSFNEGWETAPGGGGLAAGAEGPPVPPVPFNAPLLRGPTVRLLLPEAGLPRPVSGMWLAPRWCDAADTGLLAPLLLCESGAMRDVKDAEGLPVGLPFAWLWWRLGWLRWEAVVGLVGLGGPRCEAPAGWLRLLRVRRMLGEVKEDEEGPMPGSAKMKARGM